MKTRSDSPRKTRRMSRTGIPCKGPARFHANPVRIPSWPNRNRHRISRQVPASMGQAGRAGGLMSKYEADLGKDLANYEPLSPVSFLERSAVAYPGKAAIIDGERIITY